MAQSVEYNQRVDKNTNYVFDWEFTEDDGTAIDISDWEFTFLLKNSADVAVWTIANADFTRPSASRISFTKTVAQIATLNGLYSISLLVTKTGSVDDVYVYGYYSFEE